ncbi:hypothetical protein Pcinc_039642 [Petrolisthes cinctipes]|uniref:Uncharacterized protein n=1 Tax=Petrolisthes cinctipes TaxID=88211 RepID=A0AAE1BNK9_PETCI|nr:hypothetical protein Pcinc_039642 [Petrolisthes cinctipes]
MEKEEEVGGIEEKYNPVSEGAGVGRGTEHVQSVLTNQPTNHPKYPSLPFPSSHPTTKHDRPHRPRRN